MDSIIEALVHDCPFFPKAGADQDRCHSQSQIVPKNEGTCTRLRCASKWRLCLACRKQGFNDFAESVVVNSESGLCGFHETHGTEVQRGVNQGFRRRIIPNRETALFTDKEYKEDESPASRAGSSKKIPSAKKPSGILPTPVSSVLRSAEAGTEELAEDESDSSVTDQDRLTAEYILPAKERTLEVGIMMPTNRVRPMKGGQPREYFDEKALRELAGSIQSVGQLIPVLAYPVLDEPDVDWEIEDGERRWRACTLIGKDLWIIPVGRTDYALQFARSAVANFGRAQNTAVEFARAIHFVMSEFKWGYKKTALAFGVSVQTVLNHKRLLKLPLEVLALMVPDPSGQRKGLLTMVAALPLVPYPEYLQKALAQHIVKNGLTAVEARRHIRRASLAEGIKPRIGNRTRRPSDDFDAVIKKLQGISRRLSDILEESDDALFVLFASRTSTDRIAVCDSLDQIVYKTEKIRKLVESSERKT